MMTQVIKDIITWLKQWFYDKDEIDSMISGGGSTVEEKSITVTSPTSGTNYFSGGTREITAIKWGKVVYVYVNFYNVGAKAGSTSTDTTIGTLPTGWHPKRELRIRPAINNNSNIQYAQMSVASSGDIKIRVGSTTAITGATFRGAITFIAGD